MNHNLKNSAILWVRKVQGCSAGLLYSTVLVLKRFNMWACWMFRHIQQRTYTMLLFLLTEGSLDTTCTGVTFLRHRFRRLWNLLSGFGVCYVCKKKSQITKKSPIDIFPGDLGKSCCYQLYCFRYHLHPLPQPVKTGVFIALEGLKQEIKHLLSIFHPSSQGLRLEGFWYVSRDYLAVLCISMFSLAISCCCTRSWN